MNRFVSILIIAGLCFFYFSCSKNDETEFETETLPVATVQFSSPLPEAIYNNGDSVTIKATAISTESIHGYDLAIRNASDTTTSLYFIHIHEHNDTININEKWKSAVTSTPANLQAEITLYIDHEGHTKKEKVGFRVQ